ncbi:MAG: PAS domain-containing protein [Verrucomicrobiota bacterium]
MSNASFGVLLIGDQPECLRLLRQQQFEAVCADRLANGLAQLKTSHVSVVLVALSLPDTQGAEVFVKVHEAAPHLPIIALVTPAEEKLAASLMPLGLQDYLLLPELAGPMLARTIRNANERQLIRDEHIRAGHLLELLMDNIPDSIYFKDKASQYVMINRALAKRFGLADSHQAVGRSNADFFTPDYAKRALADEQRVMQTGQPLVGVEEKETWPDGRVTWMSTTKMPLRDRAGRVFGTFGISRDITEHRRIEQVLAERSDELLKERLLLRTLIDNLPDAIYAKDIAGRKTLANLTDVKNLRFKSEAETLGKTDFDLFPRELAEKLYAVDQKVIQGEPLINQEEWFVDEKGRKRWLLTSKLPLRDQDGKITGLVGINREITLRKEAEIKLAQEQELFQKLLDNLPDAIYFKDRESRFVRVSLSKVERSLMTVRNRYLADHPGAGPEKLPPHMAGPEQFAEYMLGKTDFDFYAEERARPAYEDEQAIIRTGQPSIGKLERAIQPDGRVSWLITTKMPWRDKDGKVIGTFGVSRDVTALKEAEDKLAHEQELFQTLLDNLPDAIYFKDRESRFMRVSRSKVEKTLASVRHQHHASHPSADPIELPPHLADAGSFAEYMVAKTDFDFYAEERARPAYEDEQAIMRTGQPSIGKLERSVQPDGQVNWVITTKMPWRDKDGNIIGTFGVSRDITPLKEAEQKLAEYTQQLEQKNKQTAEELKMARELQLAMLPHEFPCVPRHKPRAESDLEFFSYFLPSGAVSGDFFDVVPLSDTTVGLFICDVMGHDVRAALVTAMMRALVVDLSTTTTEPGELLAQINREVAGVFKQTGSTMYATAFYLIADVGRAELRYASAAHPEPILLHRQRGRAEWLGNGPGHKKGPALGLFADGQFPTHRCPMEVGDLIALFTDGLIEAEGADNESFSAERLLAAVNQRAKLPTNELFAGVLDEIKHFSASAEFEDDVCVVGVEVKRLETQQPNWMV